MFKTSNSTCYICFRSFFLWSALSFVLFYPDWTPALEEDTTKAPPLIPISLTDIPTQASAEQTFINQGESLLERTPILDKTEDNLLVLEQSIAANQILLSSSLSMVSSREAIVEIEKQWLKLERQLNEAEFTLRRLTSVTNQQINRFNSSLEIWKLTVTQATTDKAPDELISLARTTTDELKRMHKSLRQLQDRGLALQAKVGQARENVQNALERINNEESSFLKKLSHRERPPLWSEAITDTLFSDLITRARKEIRQWWSSIISVLENEYDRFILQIFLLLILISTMFRARKLARIWIEADPSIKKGLSMLEHPIALATLIILMITPWLYTYSPSALTDFVQLLLIVPVLVLILPLLTVTIRPALYFLSLLYIIDQFRDLVEAVPLISRIIFILEIFIAIIIIAWIIHSKILHLKNVSNRFSLWQKFIHYGLNVALSLQIIALLAAIAGYVRLAVLIGSGVLNSIYLALLLIAIEQTIASVTRLLLHSGTTQNFNVIKNRTPSMRQSIDKQFIIVAIFIWTLLSLDFFALQDYVLNIIKQIVFAKFQAGVISVSLMDILAFIITILLSIFIARLIVATLDEDVFPRVKLGRGVSFAISSVTKYGIITVGFLLAIGAMGIGMDRITILLGALGVGLGFGLQNIVNNFVSGMILIFERPMQIDDSVEIGSVKGRITRIGIRSCTIRSFEGADITVPNGTLLSEALTNWTMTDRNRRIEIAVGVAYGTDPDTVIEALHQSLEGQLGLLKEPTPQILFNGFGESSLDFLLRAWVMDNDEFVSIRSNIALSVNRILKERDIEIPYPQRDLHLRSISSDARISTSD